MSILQGCVWLLTTSGFNAPHSVRAFGRIQTTAKHTPGLLCPLFEEVRAPPLRHESIPHTTRPSSMDNDFILFLVCLDVPTFLELHVVQHESRITRQFVSSQTLTSKVIGSSRTVPADPESPIERTNNPWRRPRTGVVDCYPKRGTIDCWYWCC